MCDEEYFEQELTQLSDIFQPNWYPTKITDSVLIKMIKKENQIWRLNQEWQHKIMIAPYNKGSSEIIERFGKKLNVEVVFKYNKSMNKHRMKIKRK